MEAMMKAFQACDYVSSDPAKAVQMAETALEITHGCPEAFNVLAQCKATSLDEAFDLYTYFLYSISTYSSFSFVRVLMRRRRCVCRVVGRVVSLVVSCRVGRAGCHVPVRRVGKRRKRRGRC
jgi:hypothetical protein